MVQDGCFVEWRDIIADAARKGFAGGVPFQWNSHKILTEHLRQEWLEKLQKRRSMPRPTGNRRAPKTPEQRRKIAEAIAAKWLDQEYRERVCSAINSYHGTSAGSKVPRKPRTPRGPGAKSEAVKRKPLKNRAVTLENSHVKNATIKRKKSTTPYKDPMAGEKLEMITKIRAQRTSLEIEKKEAIKRARDAVAFAKQHGFVRVICESDCAELVNLWRGRKTQRSALAPMFSEIDEMSSSFELFEFSFVGRNANKVAHECARYACTHVESRSWDEPQIS
uniref:Uncharacterized protein n=1 Tax=Avena sativa TaxID=4498 RepID=A0ACD6ATW4_AVESA